MLATCLSLSQKRLPHVSRAMPFEKPWKGAYVCLCCCLKSNKRSFSSNLQHNNSTPASQQSTGHPPIGNQYFQSTTTSPPAVTQIEGFIGNGSQSHSQGDNQGAQDITKPSAKPKVRRSRRVHPRPRLVHMQVQSIAVFSRVGKKLSEASQPGALVDDAVQQVLQQEIEPHEKNFIDSLSAIYLGRTVEDILGELSILQKLDGSSPLDGPTETLVATLTRNGLLRAPPRSPWHREALQRDSAVNPTGSEQALQAGTATSSAKQKGRKAPARELRRLRNEEKLRMREAAAAQTETPDENTRRGKEADDVPPTSKVKHKFTSTLDADALSILQLARTGPAVPNLCHDLSRVLFNPGIYQLQDPRSRVYNFDPYLEKIMPVAEFDFKILKEYITSSKDDNLRSLAVEHGKKYVGSSSSMTSTLGQFHFLLSQWRDINTEALSRGFSDTLKSFTIIQRSPSSVFLRYQDGVYAMDADKEYDSGNILMSLGKSMEKLLTQRPHNFERYRKSSEVRIPEEERNAPEAYQYTHAGDLLMRAQLDACDPRLPGTGTFDLKTRAVVSIRHSLQQHEEGFGYQIKTRFGDWESYEREYFDMMRSAFLKYSLQVRLGQMDGIFVAFHNVERIFGFQYISLPEMDMALHGQYDTTLGDQEFKFSVELLNQVLNRVTERFPKRSLRLQFETRDLPAGGIFMQIFAEPMDEASIDAIQTSRKEAIDAFEQHLMNPEKYPQPHDINQLEAMHEHHKPLPGADMAATTLSVSADSKAPSTPGVESSMNEEPARDNAPVKGVEQIANNGRGCPDEDCGDSDTAETAKAAAKRKSKVELLALTLRIQHRVNGGVVKRPTHLTSSDNWSLDYSLEEETREAFAQAQYRASKARRKTTLEQREGNSAANYYLRKLRDMANSGAEWRKAQDGLDAGRERVVLYED